MEVNIWSDVAVRVQSALGSAKTISAITKANPAAVSSAAHGFVDGDIVLLKVAGMHQLDYVVARVDDSTTDAFELEGVDSTGYGTFASGTAEKVTFGTEASTLQSVTPSGGEAENVNIQLIHRRRAIAIPGNESALVFGFDSVWDPADPALIALKAAGRQRLALAVMFEFPSGAKVYFAGTPVASLSPGGSAGQAVTTPVSLSVRGDLLAYPS
jgi:hypothetical protein